MPLSRGQQGKYRLLVDAAYAAEAERLLGELPPKNDWRRKLNLDATGKYSTMEMSQTDDFDRVMLELAIMAEDDYWINRLSTAAERRICFVIETQFLPDLQVLEKQAIGWEYVQGICDHMHLPGNLQDCPAELLIKVMWALDTHIRRLAKRQDIELASLPSGYFRKGYNAAEAKAMYHHDRKHHHHGAAA